MEEYIRLFAPNRNGRVVRTNPRAVYVAIVLRRMFNSQTNLPSHSFTLVFLFIGEKFALKIIISRVMRVCCVYVYA